MAHIDSGHQAVYQVSLIEVRVETNVSKDAS